ncbi:MAG: glycosyltransferase family 2 protein [Prevotella sp.]|nr:glycosyltransferase family 2 protein [Prevotella sp.]
MKKELSILIPVYNDVCIECVKRLAALCESRALRFPDFVYEIVVADDASPDRKSIEANRSINNMRNCRFIEKERNTGSAATRNFLARESRYQWLLFLDCDMQIVSDSFIDLYLDNDLQPVINGGIAIGDGPKDNLRYRYEKACEERHTAAMRRQRPYQSFRSTNFMAERSLMLSIPFDERFLKSGYEDVMLGKQLKVNKIAIHHIDNPTLMTEFEANGDYLKKIERSLTTLHTFRNELRGYSGFITTDENIHLGIVKTLIRLWHRLMAPIERRNLCGRNPNLKVFNLYRIGYYISLTKND